jgi:DNA-binding NarL/FixJ family response regulator
MSAIRVVVADDQRVVRDGLVMLLGLLEGIEVVAAAGDGAEAVELAERHDADVVLMDLRMPVLDGVGATHELAARRPATAVLVLTTHADDESLFPALRAGARGYLTKDTSAAELARAIRAVHAGDTHLDPSVQRRLVESLVAPSPPARGTTFPDGLTLREGEVLALIAEGLSNQDIAARLVVSLATVKTHVNRILAKTGSRDRAQAVAYAYRHGIAGLQE